jgi:hypothetical protein
MKRRLGVRIRSWKASTVQRELEHGSREIATVRSRYQKTSIVDVAGS